MARASSRLLALDYLRGFFIIVIIIDHLWRWPSVFALITGMGALWVTSAEGFVIISGLLIGYVRGYKNKSLPLMDVSKKIWKRAAMLYGWLVGMTLIYTALVWYISTPGNTAWIEVPKYDWVHLVVSTVFLVNQHVWVHFLYIYAALMAFTPAIIWLLRKNRIYEVIAITIIGYTIGRITSVEFLEWMPMFYVPAIIGFYMDPIRSWWASLNSRRRMLLTAIIYVSTAATIIGSIVCIFIIPTNPIAYGLNQLFTKEYAFSISRIPLAYLWFTAFVLLFTHLQSFIGKYSGWLLLPFGTRSLTAYITHGTILFIIAYVFAGNESIIYNTAIGVLAIIGTWGLIKLPVIQKYVPS